MTSQLWESHEALRQEFPALNQEIYGKPLVYLDSAATSLKPRCVIDAVRSVWESDCANIHRGVHTLSQRATKRYEAARESLRRFVGAKSSREVVFVRGATEGLNLIAATLGRTKLTPGDEVLVTGLEHHANIVPWQLICEATGAKLRVAEVSDDGSVTVGAVRAALTDRTKIVSVAHVSNALGTVLPVKEIAQVAHERGAWVVVDGAQAAPHLPVNVQDIDCDFYVLSGHKLYGPDGIGILYGREAVLSTLPPYQGGGDMILSVSFEQTLYNELPYRFEAGTPSIAGAVGLGAAVEFLASLGWDRITAREHELLAAGTAILEAIPGVRIIGQAPEKIGVLSFVVEGVHPHDLGTILDREGVAIRTGHHCAQPVIERFGLSATARASLGLYNTLGELEELGRAVRKAQELFGS